MKIKDKVRLLNELAKSVENPKEFIYCIMGLQHQQAADVVNSIDMEVSHFYVCISDLNKGKTINHKTCIELAKGLDIDPIILNSVISKFALKKYMETIT